MAAKKQPRATNAAKKAAKPARAPKASTSKNPHPVGTAAWVAWRDYPFTRKGAAAPEA